MSLTSLTTTKLTKTLVLAMIMSTNKMSHIMCHTLMDTTLT